MKHYVYSCRILLEFSLTHFRVPLLLTYTDQGGTPTVTILLPGILQGTWQFVVCVYEPNEKKLKVYFNGKPKTESFDNVTFNQLQTLNLGYFENETEYRITKMVANVQLIVLVYGAELYKTGK